jgi:DNA-binding NtrC family response regulator
MARILLLDDDDDMRDVMSDMLTLEGHEVRTGRNGVEGLQALDVELPQIVITDLEMPVLDGYGMVYRLFVENLGRENVPIIVISGAAVLPQIAAALGTPYFLPKPFSLEALLTLINRALAEAIPPRPPGLLGEPPRLRP